MVVVPVFEVQRALGDTERAKRVHHHRQLICVLLANGSFDAPGVRD